MDLIKQITIGLLIGASWSGAFGIQKNDTFQTSQEKMLKDVDKPYYIGSSLFILANLIPDDPNAPDFIQLNLGYRRTQNDVFSLEIKTWKYGIPLGIPFGNSWDSSKEKYPGYVRDFGIGLVYQRFYWKGAYASVDAMNTFERFVNEINGKRQNGYMLFMTYRLGYNFNFFQNKIFIEPSVAATHWPIRTNVPEAFSQVDSKWPNYFLFEPGLHFGINF